jgi:triacylglycerol esterase/lipase EstA (alpha/beta hydrolase family)
VKVKTVRRIAELRRSTIKIASRVCFFACLAVCPSTCLIQLHASTVDAINVGSTGGYIKDHGNPKVIVFVHGLFSSPDAWRCDGQHYWPAMIANDSDPAFADTDVYVVGYPTPQKHGKMTISQLDTVIMNRLEADGVFSRHKEVVFVAHSLGGLVTQQLLLTYRDKGLYKKVSFLYLYGTPEEGSKLANIGKYFNADPLLKELEEGEGNFILHDMDEKWLHADFKSIKRFCAYETQPENGFKVVDPNSATRGCEENVAIPANHREMVKPCSSRSDAYLALENKLRTVTLNNEEASTQSSTVVNAPNGIVNLNGTLINPQVTNNYGARGPAPNVSWEFTTVTSKVPPQNLDIYLSKHIPPPPYRDVSEEQIGIKLSSTFYNAAFLITCERACRANYMSLDPGGVQFETYGTNRENVTVLVVSSPSVLSPGPKMSIGVTALDERPMTIIDVKPYLLP